MARAAATVVSGHNQGALIVVSPGRLSHSEAVTRAVEQPTRMSASRRAATIVGKRAFPDFVLGVAAECVTLLLQAELVFQKYRFSNGLMLGTAVASVDWYSKTVRRKGSPLSRVTPILIAAAAAALTLVVQQALGVLASSLPQTITHS
jgi:hypothetical protein